MTKTKFDALVRSLSSVAAKVFDSVPAKEPWTKQEIHADLLRRKVGSSDLRMTEGCLNSLKQTKLVQEKHKGQFVRVKVNTPKKNPPYTPAPKEPTMTDTTKSPFDPTIFDLMGTLAFDAQALALAAAKLTADIDYAALAIEEHMATLTKETEQLTQLKALLKNIA